VMKISKSYLYHPLDDNVLLNDTVGLPSVLNCFAKVTRLAVRHDNVEDPAVE